MPNTIAPLPPATALTGAEPLPVSQSSADVRTTVDAVAARASALGFIATGATASLSPADRAVMPSVDVRDFGAVFDGRDNTAALQAAMTLAGSIGAKIVQMPAGQCFLSATISVPHGVTPVGMGSINTFLRRTGDYGHTFDYASGYNGGGARGFTVYHDHGAGFSPPNTAAAYVNPVTHGAHFNLPLVGHSQFSDLLVASLPYQFFATGGLRNTFIGVEILTDIWDNQTPALQVGLAGVTIRPGPANEIPTDWEFYACRIGGLTSPKRTITWPGGPTTMEIDNIGALYGLDIQGSEGIRWFGGYLGGLGWAAVRLYATPGHILSAFSLRDAFVDSNHQVGLLIDRSGGGTSNQVTWAPHEHNFQGNGYRGISDAGGDLHSGTAGGQVSVLGFTVEGQYRAFVGDVIFLETANSVRIDINARGWNLYGFYSSLIPYDAGIYIGGGCKTVSVSGVLGGGLDGAGTSGTDTVGVRYTLAGNSSNVSVTATAGLGTILAEDVASSLQAAAWSAFVPTVSAATGALGAYTASGRNHVVGKTCFVSLLATITSAGTGGAYLVVSLPVAGHAAYFQSLSGLDAATGKALSVMVQGAAAVVRDYAGGYIGASGTKILVTGSFETA